MKIEEGASRIYWQQDERKRRANLGIKRKVVEGVWYGRVDDYPSRET